MPTAAFLRHVAAVVDGEGAAMPLCADAVDAPNEGTHVGRGVFVAFQIAREAVDGDERGCSVHLCQFADCLDELADALLVIHRCGCHQAEEGQTGKVDAMLRAPREEAPLETALSLAD